MPAAKPIPHQRIKPPGFRVFNNVSEGSMGMDKVSSEAGYAEPKVSVRDRELLSQQKKPAHTYLGNSAEVFNRLWV
jgi:hypothetical protein